MKCPHDGPRYACQHHAARCEVCGFRVSVPSALFAWLDWRQRQFRWPRRKRVYEVCPECGTNVVVVTQLGRDALEVA